MYVNHCSDVWSVKLEAQQPIHTRLRVARQNDFKDEQISCNQSLARQKIISIPVHYGGVVVMKDVVNGKPMSRGNILKYIASCPCTGTSRLVPVGYTHSRVKPLIGKIGTNINLVGCSWWRRQFILINIEGGWAPAGSRRTRRNRSNSGWDDSATADLLFISGTENRQSRTVWAASNRSQGAYTAGPPGAAAVVDTAENPNSAH